MVVEWSSDFCFKKYREMLSYIEICTLIYDVFLCLSKSLRKLITWQKAAAVLSTNQYILVYTGIYWIYQHTYKYDSVYLITYSYEDTHTAARPYIRVHCVSGYKSVYTRIYAYKHFAKICTVPRFEPWIWCTPHSCSDRYTTSVDVFSVYHMIYVRLHITFRVWLQTSGAERFGPAAPTNIDSFRHQSYPLKDISHTVVIVDWHLGSVWREVQGLHVESF